MMTLTEARHEFKVYFWELEDDGKKNDYTVDRQEEWNNFVKHKIEMGELPANASEWKL